MVSHRQTALLIVTSVLLITEVKWYYEQRQQLDQLTKEMDRVEGRLIAREEDMERVAVLTREAVNRCEKKRISKLADISECRESVDKHDTTTTTTTSTTIGTNNKQIYIQQLIRRCQVELDSCYNNTNRLEREYRECESRRSQKEDTKSSTESTPLHRINSFLLFLGYARSGHSIVAALLDAHPHIVISHELHAVQRWAEYYSVDRETDRQGLFSEIIENSKSNLKGDKGFRSPNFTQKYYTLDVPGLYQGRYEDYIRVIGDKKGGSLVSMYKGTEEDFKELEKFQNFVGYPLRIIHIVRNPYDNIATKFLYGISGDARKDAIEEDTLIESEDTEINVYVKRHLNAFQKVQRFIEYFGDRMITLHHEDLIENPIQFLTTLCNYLVITCSNQYLEKASEVVFSNVSKSRYNVKWSQETRYEIKSAIERYTFLNRYSYED